MGRPLCRHCHAESVTRPRGLGWKCFYAPGVRDLYPPVSKYAAANAGRQLPVCPACGNVSGMTARDFAAAGGVCSTCKWPEPYRSERHARIAAMELRADRRLPVKGGAA